MADAPKKKPARKKPHYHGHRERLRARFVEGGREALADYEVLELLLFRSIPRRDTKQLAKDLIAHFGSLAEVLTASHDRLCEVPGIKEATAIDLSLVRMAADELALGQVAGREVLSSWQQLLNYCRSTMAFSKVEELRILFLDRRNQLIRDELQQSGTIDHTPVYPREVVKRALELEASAIILVHNHPSGDPTPSQADVTMTNAITRAAQLLGVTVHDHVIVGRDGHASLRAMGLIENLND